VSIPRSYFDWMVPDRLAACVNPAAAPTMLETLRAARIEVAVNLHEQLVADVIAPLGIREVHIPVTDMTPPTQADLDRGVAAIRHGLASGQRFSVSCGAGLGRTGTLVAAYFVSQGMTADAAIAHVRALRPGSIETPEQEAAVAAYAGSVQPGNASSPVGS
jgi:atypical dual specificity phosphatase